MKGGMGREKRVVGVAIQVLCFDDACISEPTQVSLIDPLTDCQD
jgi:hypothetical protein